MKVRISQGNFVKGLALVGRAVALRSTMPILGNILLEATDAGLRLAATDLEIGLDHTVPAQTLLPGAITLPARQLADYVNALPPDTVEMELNPKTQTVHFQCARYVANIKGVDASEFPIIGFDTAEYAELLLDPDALRDAVRLTSFSAAKDDARPVLRGVFVQVSKGKAEVVFAAADGFRLSVAHAALSEKSAASAKVVIPAPALDLAARIAANQETPVTLFLKQDAPNVGVVFENTKLFAAVLDGQFPDYTQIVPKTHAVRTVVNRAEIEHALRANEIFARENSNRVFFHPTLGTEAGGSTMRLEAHDVEGGNVTAELDATVSGEPHEFALNARFVREVVGAVDAPQIVFETTTIVSPIVVRPVGADNFTHVIMPMAI